MVAVVVAVVIVGREAMPGASRRIGAAAGSRGAVRVALAVAVPGCGLLKVVLVVFVVALLVPLRADDDVADDEDAKVPTAPGKPDRAISKSFQACSSVDGAVVASLASASSSSAAWRRARRFLDRCWAAWYSRIRRLCTDSVVIRSTVRARSPRDGSTYVTVVASSSWENVLVEALA